MLSVHRIQHRVLDASQDVDEAAIVAKAGRARHVTVVTNMAGRGTDIPLSDGVAESGGLHLVSLAFNDARRIDRQLIGRTARQGDAGSFQQIWALDELKLHDELSSVCITFSQFLLNQRVPSRTASKAVLMFVQFAQRRIEWRHLFQRRIALRTRQRTARHVALSGHPEHPA